METLAAASVSVLLAASLGTPAPNPAANSRPLDRLQAAPDSFEWAYVARRLQTDSLYRFRQAARRYGAELEDVPAHRTRLRDARGQPKVVLSILVDRPLTSEEVARVLASELIAHTDTQVIARVALADTAGDDRARTIVTYMWVDLPTGGGRAEFFCVPHGAPEGLLLDEGERLSIPRCDDTLGGDPWPVVGMGRALAQAMKFYASAGGLLFLKIGLPLIVLFGLTLLSGADRQSRLSLARALDIWTVVAVAVVAAGFTAALLMLSPGLHPVAMSYVFLQRSARTVTLFAAPTVLLLVMLANSRRIEALPAGRTGAKRAVRTVLALTVVLFLLYVGVRASIQGPLELFGPENPDVLGNTLDRIARARAEGYSLTAPFIDLSVILLVGLGVAPIAEELFWRGLGLPLLERSRGPAFAVVVSALLFASVHLVYWWPLRFRGVLPVVGALGLGLLTGYAFVWKRSLGLCVALHIAWSGAVIAARTIG